MSSPPSIDHIRYVPDFISEQEEQALLARVYGAPKPKWRALSRRRLQEWGGTVELTMGRQPALLKDQMPEWLDQCIDRIMALPPGTFPTERRPNHVLVNEYLPGQGIFPHTDGPAYHPLISTISLGSHTLLDLYEKISDDDSRTFMGSILLERRSLVLISDRAYQMLHGIEERTSDVIRPFTILNLDALGDTSLATEGRELVRDTRVSLTIRNVERVLTSGLLTGKLASKNRRFH